MKKTFFNFIIIMLIFSLTHFCCFAEDIEKTYFDTFYSNMCFDKLKEFGILENSEMEYITRRNAFLAAYKVKDPNGNNDILYSRTPEELSDIFEYHANKYDIQNFSFADIEYGSEDYYFTAILIGSTLITGDKNNGNFYVRYDDYLTYGEALTILSRILIMGREDMSNDHWIKTIYKSDTPFYDYMIDLGVINNKFPNDSCCPQIAKKDLNLPIKIAEFSSLLYRMLYIPSYDHGDYASPYFHYHIEDFTEPIE